MSEAIHVVCPACNAVNRIPAERLGQNPKCGKCKQPLFTGKPVELDEPGFTKQIQRSDIPVVVDFWAPWCGPCRMMAPAFEQAARELEPHFRLAKLNTENERNVAMQYRIMSIPTLAVFRHGRELARQAGAMDAGTLVRWVRSVVR
jgi:thioredoxin 2